MLVSNFNEKKTAIGKFVDYGYPLHRLMDSKNKFWGLQARNKEQSFAFDLLANPDVHIITLIGKSW